jgi:hypothetical protein
MSKLLCSTLIVLLLFSCKKEKTINHFDEIIHYNIDDEMAKKNDTIKRFNEIYMSVYGHKINFDTFEKELISYGYKKNIIPNEKILKIDEFVSNDIYYDSHLTACVPFYRDILILKKDNKIVSVLKLCFECSMIDKYGVLESSYGKNVDFDTYFMNFENFYKTLYSKPYKRKL